MAKVSASTLVRRASKTKDQKVAKRLRSLAAKARREERAKKVRGVTKASFDKHVAAFAREDRKREERRAANKAALSGGQTVGNGNGGGAIVAEQSTDKEWRLQPPVPHVGDGEMDLLRMLAKKKSDPHGEFPHEIRMMVNRNRAEASRIALQGSGEAAQRQMEAQRINVVCAFLAEMEGVAALNKGPLPRCVMIAGYTLARVVDALRQAGYTAEGKEGMKRV